MAGTSSPDRSSAPSTEGGGDAGANWAERHTPAGRAALVDTYTGLVRRIAARCFRRRVGNELEYADFLQFGMVGLLEALDRYTPARGVRFESYAGHRIEGAILNGVQGLSEFQRQVSVRRGLLKERNAALLGASAGGGEETDLSATGGAKSALERLAEVAIGLALGFALEDAGLYVDGEPATPDNAYEQLELRQFKQQLATRVARLPEGERRVLTRHYFQQQPFEEIARGMGLTKGRVSQLHHAGLRRLRQQMQAAHRFELIG